MADQLIKAASPLLGFTHTIGDTVVREVSPISLVSIATPLGGGDALDALLEKTIKLKRPAIGKLHRSEQGDALLGLQTDQCLLVSDSDVLDPATALKQTLGNAAYLTDQSDGWVIVEIAGPLSRAALERICPIDLAEDNFTEHDVARTSMEHLSVIIERIGLSCFRLYSPRSSADSFLHAITLSLSNVADE
ncbi:MAG: sarcosine oxidase subunit gamma [Granulosicoccus sp.]